MITVRTGKWTKDDKVFLGEVIDKGLEKCCFAYGTGCQKTICQECKNKIACAELKSVMFYIWAILARDEAQISKNENKSL